MLLILFFWDTKVQRSSSQAILRFLLKLKLDRMPDLYPAARQGCPKKQTEMKTIQNKTGALGKYLNIPNNDPAVGLYMRKHKMKWNFKYSIWKESYDLLCRFKGTSELIFK